jgi:hypothetical protein
VISFSVLLAPARFEHDLHDPAGAASAGVRDHVALEAAVGDLEESPTPACGKAPGTVRQPGPPAPVEATEVLDIPEADTTG